MPCSRGMAGLSFVTTQTRFKHEQDDPSANARTLVSGFTREGIYHKTLLFPKHSFYIRPNCIRHSPS